MFGPGPLLIAIVPLESIHCRSSIAWVDHFCLGARWSQQNKNRTICCPHRRQTKNFAHSVEIELGAHRVLSSCLSCSCVRTDVTAARVLLCFLIAVLLLGLVSAQFGCGSSCASWLLPGFESGTVRLLLVFTPKPKALCNSCFDSIITVITVWYLMFLELSFIRERLRNKKPFWLPVAIRRRLCHPATVHATSVWSCCSMYLFQRVVRQQCTV